MKKIIFAILATLLIAIVALAFDFGRKDDTKPVNFKECALKGYPIQEIFPRRCATPEGEAFTEEATDKTGDINKSNLIKISAPMPDEIVKSPLIISGVARGYWFFEASFPVNLVDDSGNEIASGIAQAEGNWMTAEFVPFKAELNFEKPSAKSGKLILKKDNPSGLSQNDDELIIPVYFD